MEKNLFLLLFIFVNSNTNAQFDKIKTTQNNRQVVKPVMVNNQSEVLKNTAVNTVAYDFSKVNICLDIATPGHVNLPPRRNSGGPPIAKIKPDGTLLQVGVNQQPLTGVTEKMWSPADIISVYLSPLNGSDFIRNRIQFYAKKWEAFANIRFEFINDLKAANIKVGLFKSGQSWSWLGRDVLFNPLNAYTMNFGSFGVNTDEQEMGRVIIHEFGHVLGFDHEHLSPASPLRWNLDKTYKYYKEKNNWTPEHVDLNVIKKLNQNNTNYSAYDRYSVMHYTIPEDLLLSGSGTTINYKISQIDGQYARLWYPFPPEGINTTGNLRTNDDCDDVFFKVEYNVVAADQVEFVLSLGENNRKKVTWWKQIGIPRTNNTETVLWVQNHSLIREENRAATSIQIPINEINSNKGISFWKAKILGIHTLLGYKWNVLPAIKGGCRITLTWNRDSCS